jgi:hypothetical protein
MKLDLICEWGLEIFKLFSKKVLKPKPEGLEIRLKAQQPAEPELRYVLKSRIAQNLSMKEGSLFCSYEIHQTRMLQIVFLVSLESSQPGGVHGLGSVAFGLWCKSS